MTATDNRSLLQQTRRHLHAHPEVSGQEVNTQKYILDFLAGHTKAEVIEVGQTGVLATFAGDAEGRHLLIRGDIDALPIQEVNDFEHKSCTAGVSHKCGHDGHTTIILGLAMRLSEQPIARGRVSLLFQPAEENGKGSVAVLTDPAFAEWNFDYAFALHNLPGYPLHQVVVKEQEFTVNVKSLIVRLHGKTAHAAEPEKGHNPALVIAAILQYAEKLTHSIPADDDFFLITPIHVQMGELAYGISAGYAEVHLTIRSWSTALMEDRCKQLESFIRDSSLTASIRPEMEYLEEFHANINDPRAVSFIEQAAIELGLDIHTIDRPFKWGEDFGLFTQRYPGAMFGIGGGVDLPALHNPDYDYPDEITPTGIDIFHTTIQKALDA